MKIKTFKQFNEDANANASTPGMGAVTSATPGSSPGTTGTTGSGDVSNTLGKQKKKMGNASEVSNAQNLKPAKTNKVKQ